MRQIFSRRNRVEGKAKMVDLGSGWYKGARGVEVLIFRGVLEIMQ